MTPVNGHPSTQTSSTSSFRAPLVSVRNPPSPEAFPQDLNFNTEKTIHTGGHVAYYQVLWRKPSAKKHKTWDGDAILTVRNGVAALRDTITGKEMGRTSFEKPLLPGSTLSVAGKEIEVDEVLKERPSYSKSDERSSDVASTRVTSAKRPVETTSTMKLPRQKTDFGNSLKRAVQEHKEGAKKVLNLPAPRSLAIQNVFKNPMKDTSNLPQLQTGPEPVPRHDPNAPRALVMKRPPKVPEGKRIVDVVLDPTISRHLRDHQREGVKFLYECVMGLRDFDGEGAILADEMGLGKTLQTIALIWTLLKQNPISGNPPVVKKALIVCPVTLINNWRKEFRKWLGNERIGVFVADGKKTRLTDFTMGKSYSVMIIGYERLRQVAEDLTKGAGIDLVVADEGHRLKTAQNKSAQAIQTLNTPKRIILSGTPIQNDLSEFFTMVNFVNDGILGSYKQFVKQFETPIVRSRQPNSLQEHIEEGEECSEELARLTTPFILRRTADILSKYLPAKTEYVLFCDLLPAQAYVYRNVLASPIFQSIGNSQNALQLITILRKICNSPFLIHPRNNTDDESGSPPKILEELIETLPPQLTKSLSNQASTKLRLLDQLLDSIRKKTNDKVVLVSNFTATLDLLAALLGSSGLPFLRLDGSTPPAKRQALVDDFNRSPASSCFAFLLSAKAGGVGLNLIGASRLVLFDVDWNPAVDMQAMARIHREGQRKQCRIYRFVVKGSVEERIWQRQVTKVGLADSVMEMGSAGGGKGNAMAQFSREELRDLFRLDESEDLRTHGLLSCDCHGSGIKEQRQEQSKDEEFIDIDALDSVSSTDVLPVEIKDSEEFLPQSDSDEEDDIPVRRRFSKASRVNMSKQEELISAGMHPRQGDKSTRKAKEKAAQTASLMLYQHIEVSKITSSSPAGDRDVGDDEDINHSLEDVVGDEVLMQVLRNEGNKVKWVFRKTSENAKVVTKDDE